MHEAALTSVASTCGATTSRATGPLLGVYFGGLIIAGALTFYPGRLTYRCSSSDRPAAATRPRESAEAHQDVSPQGGVFARKKVGESTL
jgi:hypothetical protein